LNARPYTVSELTALVRDALGARPELEEVLVEGELSNVNSPASGHLYFTLKDGRAAVHCVCFRSNALRIPFHPENGMTVVVHGTVQVYDAQGRYQINADRMDPSGVGALTLAVEQVKRKLSAEGVFDDRHKRRLPLLPQRVVVVTSRTGAAWRDVCTVMSRRAPGVDIVLSPATVQGEGAAETIVRALRRADGVRGAEVILLVRGGGSIEDLMPFNSEAVARAIRSTRLPVITGIGHETDTTVADLAADRRAATPSAAAEVVVPAVMELHRQLVARRERLGQVMRGLIGTRRTSVERTWNRLGRLSPAATVASLRQDLDRRAALLRHALLREVAVQRRRLDAAAGRLQAEQPVHRIAGAKARLGHLDARLRHAGATVVERKRSALAPRSARLEALSPLNTLGRGYSITLDGSGRVVADAAAVDAGETIRTLLHRGVVDSVVQRSETAGELGRTDVRLSDPRK
jgi:exodeoxyribonuclease VII large subunit